MGYHALLQGIFPDSGIKPKSPASPALAGGFFNTLPPGKPFDVYGSPGGASGKEPACQCRRRKRLGFDPWVGKIPWRRAWQPTPVILPRESHGHRSLAGYSPWGPEESDTTKATWRACTGIHIYICVCVCVCVYIYIYICIKYLSPLHRSNAWLGWQVTDVRESPHFGGRGIGDTFR